MPVDPAMVDAMVGPFRDMLAGALAQGAEGDDVDEMGAALAAMEALGQELQDAGDLAGRLAAEGHYQRFTDAYSRAMLAAAGGGGAGAIPDDATLLEQSVTAYESSLRQLRSAEAVDEGALAAVERIVAIGRSGVTYPVFLTQLEEERLPEALAAGAAPSRESLAAALAHHQRFVDPPRATEAMALLKARDELAAASPTGAVDPFAFELARLRIAWEHAPAIARRDALVPRVGRLLDLVVDWLDAHTSWAPHDDRFQGATAADTERNVARTRECNPGFLAVRAATFAAMFGPEPWWTRPELAEERSTGRIAWTDARVQLALDAIPSCVPLATTPADLVARAEAFGANAF